MIFWSGFLIALNVVDWKRDFELVISFSLNVTLKVICYLSDVLLNAVIRRAKNPSEQGIEN